MCFYFLLSVEQEMTRLFHFFLSLSLRYFLFVHSFCFCFCWLFHPYTLLRVCARICTNYLILSSESPYLVLLLPHFIVCFLSLESIRGQTDTMACLLLFVSRPSSPLFMFFSLMLHWLILRPSRLIAFSVSSVYTFHPPTIALNLFTCSLLHWVGKFFLGVFPVSTPDSFLSLGETPKECTEFWVADTDGGSSLKAPFY